MKFTSESSMPIPNIQFDSVSKEIFHKVLSGASWLSQSPNVNREEHQPLLKKCHLPLHYGKPTATSYSILERDNGKLQPKTRHQVNEDWQQKCRSHQIPVIDMQKSVSISEVCRTTTPLLPPIQAEREGISWVGAAFLLVNSALGIGILNFPAAYNQAGGIAAATLIQLGMLGLVIVTMLILAYCSDVNGDVTYHDVLMSMCGGLAQKLAAMSITFNCYSVSVAVLIIIGDQLDRLFLSIFGPHFCYSWYLDRRFTVSIVAICFILPMCYCRRVDFLRYTGSLGIFAMLYPVFLTVYGYFKLDVSQAVVKTHPDDIAKFFAVVPVLCLAYQCQEVVVPVYSCLKNRNIKDFSKSCFLSMGFLIGIYSLIGCFGYLTFGTVVQPNVMKMYDASDPVVIVGGGALIIKMIVTYPVLSLCGRGAVDGLYAELTGLSAVNFVVGEKKRRIVLTTLWFVSSLLVALHTSTIGSVITVLGAMTAINIFVFPGLCLIRFVMKKDEDFKRRKSQFLVAGAIMLVALGTFLSSIVLLNMILGHNHPPPVEVLCS